MNGLHWCPFCGRIHTRRENGEPWNTRAERICHMEYIDEWSGDELYPTEAYRCSECGHITQEGLPSYCPRCGAKVMEE